MIKKLYRMTVAVFHLLMMESVDMIMPEWLVDWMDAWYDGTIAEWIEMDTYASAQQKRYSVVKNNKLHFEFNKN